MRYQQDLQVALRDRFRRLMTTGYTTYGHEVGLICRWINEQPALRAIVEDLATAEPEVMVDEWVQACEQNQGLQWPTSTEAGRARLVWAWMRDLDQDPHAVLELASSVDSSRNFNDAVRGMTQSVVSVVFDYLGERLSAESSVLYLLERYVRRVEWFERARLHDQYLANTRQGEQIYDTDLRRWLFDQGLNMPFSQAKSASGLSDVLGELDTEDPLVCEVKVFDAASHDKRGIVSGVHQVVQYAQDYGKSAGHLMIINLSGRALDLPSDANEKTWPPYVEVSGVRVHLINVRALPTASASKLGQIKPVTITREDLINPDV